MNLTPEQQEEMWNWYQARKAQALPYPLDAVSKNSIPNSPGLGASALTDTVSIGAGGGSASVPKAYAGTLLIVFDGVTYEVPFLRTV